MTTTRRGLLQQAAYGLGLLTALRHTGGHAKPTPFVSMQGDPELLGRFLREESRIAVVGGGISGLVTALEILKARPEANLLVLEANDWIGGRLMTARYGSRIQEVGGPMLECKFDDGLYMNAGAGRIPHHHDHTLRLCRELAIPLESFVLASRANLLHSDETGEVIQARRIKHDLRGHISEALLQLLDDDASSTLITEALDIGQHDDPILELKCLFQRFGDLDHEDLDFCRSDFKQDPKSKLVYNNSTRRGYQEAPGPWDENGKLNEILSMDDILKSDVYPHNFRDMRHYWQASLMQPVGGMDNLARYVLNARVGKRRLSDYVFYRAPVTEIRRVQDDRTRLSFQAGRERVKVVCDQVVSTMAPPLLAALAKRFEKRFVDALGEFQYIPACKVGWQSNTRFWETDDQIYGGISYTSDIISQIWYPSSEYHSEKGVLTGAYNRGEQAATFGSWSHEKRISHAYDVIKKIHKGAGNAIDTNLGLSLAWQNMPYHAGGWSEESKHFKASYDLVASQPIANFTCSGDFLSHTPGWINGAVGSGQRAAQKVLAGLSRQSERVSLER